MSKSTKFRFVNNLQNQNRNICEPDYKLHKFHQICMFKDPRSSKYNVRTVIIDENHDIIKSIIKQYTSSQCMTLIKSNKVNKYKIYPTYDLELIDYPNGDDILKLKSDLLSDDQASQSGYALF